MVLTGWDDLWWTWALWGRNKHQRLFHWKKAELKKTQILTESRTSSTCSDISPFSSCSTAFIQTSLLTCGHHLLIHPGFGPAPDIRYSNKDFLTVFIFFSVVSIVLSCFTGQKQSNQLMLKLLHRNILHCRLQPALQIITILALLNLGENNHPRAKHEHQIPSQPRRINKCTIWSTYCLKGLPLWDNMSSLGLLKMVFYKSWVTAVLTSSRWEYRWGPPGQEESEWRWPPEEEQPSSLRPWPSPPWTRGCCSWRLERTERAEEETALGRAQVWLMDPNGLLWFVWSPPTPQLPH